MFKERNVKRKFRLTQRTPEHPSGIHTVAISTNNNPKEYEIIVGLHVTDDFIKESDLENNEVWVECPKETLPYEISLDKVVYKLDLNNFGSFCGEDNYPVFYRNGDKEIVIEDKKFWSGDNSEGFFIESLINRHGDIFRFDDVVHYFDELQKFTIKQFTCVEGDWYINDHYIPETIKPNLENLLVVPKK